jgi:excisionase family DNA binding protein
MASAQRPALKRQETADMFGVSVATIDRLIADGTLPVIRLGKRNVRIPREAVEQLLAGKSA